MVDEQSATLGIYPSHGLPLDHYNLNKFASPDDGNFKNVQETIKEMYISAQNRGRGPSLKNNNSMTTVSLIT